MKSVNCYRGSVVCCVYVADRGCTEIHACAATEWQSNPVVSCAAGANVAPADGRQLTLHAGSWRQLKGRQPSLAATPIQASTQTGTAAGEQVPLADVVLRSKCMLSAPLPLHRKDQGDARDPAINACHIRSEAVGVAILAQSTAIWRSMTETDVATTPYRSTAGLYTAPALCCNTGAAGSSRRQGAQGHVAGGRANDNRAAVRHASASMRCGASPHSPLLVGIQDLHTLWPPVCGPPSLANRPNGYSCMCRSGLRPIVCYHDVC